VGEESRGTMLVLWDATVPFRAGGHRGEKALRLYGRPSSSTIARRARAGEQGACVQILQFAQELAERRTVPALGACTTARGGKARDRAGRRATTQALEDYGRNRDLLFRADAVAGRRRRVTIEKLPSTDPTAGESNRAGKRSNSEKW